MKTVLYLIIFFLSITFFYSCNSCKQTKPIPKTEDSLKIIYSELSTEQKEIVELIYQWNKLHDTAYLDGIDTFYNDVVLFYKRVFSKQNIINTKKYRIAKAKQFRQLIIGRIGIYPSDTGDYKCEFLKLVNIDNKPKVYRTYLVFKKIDDKWKIIVESDRESDLAPDMLSLFSNFQESESTSLGDFDGDDEKEELIVIKPEKDSSGNYLNTTTKISFTNLNLPEIILDNCVGVNVLNENDVDGDGADDFSVVMKKPDGQVGNVILFTYKRGKWQKTAQFVAPESEVFKSRKDLIEFAGNGNIKIRTVEKTAEDNDTLIIKTISTWE